MNTLSRLFVCLFTALVAQSALGQAWPSKPLRLIVTFPPGGTSDIAARLVGNVAVVDVRGAVEWAAGRLPGARTIGDAATSCCGVIGKAGCGAGAVAQPASANTKTTPIVATQRLMGAPL